MKSTMAAVPSRSDWKRPAAEAAPASRAAEWTADASEIAARVAIVVGFTFLAYRLGAHFAETGRPTGLLLVASEALVVVLTLFRRATEVVDRSLRARILTAVSLMGPLFAVPATGAELLPETATVAISAAGLLVVIVGKLSLGRSFGLMPANRGVVSSGLYRLVRHPIYLGYLITHVGFVAANAVPWNILMLMAADFALLVRAKCEERVLAEDAAYRAYRDTVRWRVVPGLF